MDRTHRSTIHDHRREFENRIHNRRTYTGFGRYTAFEGDSGILFMQLPRFPEAPVTLLLKYPGFGLGLFWWPVHTASALNNHARQLSSASYSALISFKRTKVCLPRDLLSNFGCFGNVLSKKKRRDNSPAHQEKTRPSFRPAPSWHPRTEQHCPGTAPDRKLPLAMERSRERGEERERWRKTTPEASYVGQGEKDLDCCTVIQGFQMKVNFAFHLEIEVPESGGRVERPQSKLLQVCYDCRRGPADASTLPDHDDVGRASQVGMECGPTGPQKGTLTYPD
ncbi:unnamed protein product [Ranitomeya imitator]|uniref:Uncharacterized protein n=1 Tax=Ranitomeya imitator TaxID=111125 RepID=A0ABN9M9H0_9NEOB|nr:unnamed protein product [Ranitomeya imitator]